MPKYRGTLKRGNWWYYRIYWNGKQKEYGRFETAEEAHNARVEHLSRIVRNRVTPQSITLREFIIQYLKEYECIHNRYTTAKKTEGICRNHIAPVLGHIKLQSLKVVDIVRFTNYLVSRKKPSVAHNTMRVLRKILNKAVEWEFISTSPLKCKLPPLHQREHSIITIEKLFEMVESLKGADKYVIAIAGFTGMRISEIFGLKWEDINFAENTIHIRRQFIQGRIYEYTKTKESRVVIPIWEKLSFMLKEWRLASGSPDWVFKGVRGYPQSPNGWRYLHWYKIKKRFNLPEDFRFHDLRHTFTSVLLAGGATVGDVQKLLRHATYRTTMDIYRHIISGQLERNFDILNRLYREKDREEKI